jgi:hypothetical protein
MGHNIDNLVWRKSTYSGSNGGNCVEIAVLAGDGRVVRDSKDPGGPVLAFGPDDWRAFTVAIKAGEFDLA